MHFFEDYFDLCGFFHLKIIVLFFFKGTSLFLEGKSLKDEEEEKFRKGKK